MPKSKFAVTWKCKLSLEEVLGLDWEHLCRGGKWRARWMDFLRDSKNIVRRLSVGQQPSFQGKTGGKKQELVRTIKSCREIKIRRKELF